jgi:hypothetical protein
VASTVDEQYHAVEPDGEDEPLPPFSTLRILMDWCPVCGRQHVMGAPCDQAELTRIDRRHRRAIAEG